MSSSKKRIAIIALLLLLAAIPLTAFLVFRQQELRSRAEPATTMSFKPASTESSPLTKTVGELATLSIDVNTGTNSISGAEIHLQYDQSKISDVSIDIAPTPLLPQVFLPGSAAGGSAFISVGSRPDDPKKGEGTLAVLRFRASAPTGGALPVIRFTTDTKVAGAGEGATDVLLKPLPPAFLLITAVVPTPTIIPTPTSVASTPTPTPRAGATPTPGRGGNIGIGSSAPTPTRINTPTPPPQAVGPTVPPKTAAPPPVTADIGPTTALTIGGVVLFLIGALSLLAL